MCNAIRRIMDERGLRPTPFARSVGVKTSTMFSIYRGQVQMKNIAVGNFLKIAHGLGMTAEELYYGEKQPIAYADEREADMHRIWGELDEERRGRLHSTAQDMELAKSNGDSELQRRKEA